MTEIAVVVSDIDYTLVDFGKGHHAAIEALAKTFGWQLADEVNSIFRLVLEGHRRADTSAWKERQAFQDVEDKIRQLQGSCVDVYGVKPWSREAWMVLAAERVGMSITPQQVEEMRDLYWMTLGLATTLYSDTYVFLESIQSLKLPLLLMTSSDSICNVGTDYSITYDPAHSKRYKKTRLEQLSIPHQGIVIGDPIDKPDPRFFDSVFKMVAVFRNVAMENILFIGDSERSDLQEPRRRGCATFLVSR